jgi:hypothetical protein
MSNKCINAESSALGDCLVKIGVIITFSHTSKEICWVPVLWFQKNKKIGYEANLYKFDDNTTLTFIIERIIAKWNQEFKFLQDRVDTLDFRNK